MRRIFLALFLALSVVPGLLPAGAAAKPTVSDLRLGLHEGFTRFVIELSEPVAWRVFALADPHRLVIDLPTVGWALPAELAASKKGLVGGLRFGNFAEGVSRIVIDLTAPAAVRTVELLPANADGRHRLFVDLVPSGEPEFRQLVGSAPQESAAPPPRAEAETTQPPPPAPKRDKRPLIVIDAGHGGVDPGATSITGVFEKTIMLDYALELEKQLTATGRYRVELTRRSDVFIALPERYALAERTGADLFISLHANTHAKSSIRGASVFTLSEKGADSDAEAAALAAKENAADKLAGLPQADDVALILGDLMRRETMNLSKNFANMLVAAIGKDLELLRNTHRYASFRVLKSPAVPSVLIEIGYLSNASEEKAIRTKKHRQTVALAIVRALDDYFVWQEALNRS